MKKAIPYFILIFIILLLVFIFNNYVNSLVTAFTFNVLSFIDNTFNLSSKINPIITWSMLFALFGTCYGLIKASNRFKLDKKIKAVGYILPFLLLGLIYLSSKPLNNGDSRGIFEEKQWQIIKSSNSYALCTNYLDNFPKGKYSSLVTIKQEQALWDSAIVTKTSIIWDFYIKKFPNSEKDNEAKNNFEKFLWREVKTENTLDSYNKYINAFPYGRYYQKAKKASKKLSRNENTQNVVVENSTLQKIENNVSEAVPTQIPVSEEDSSKGSVSTENSQQVQKTETQGTYTYSDGRKFEGTLLNGIPNGKGKEFFPDNTVLLGKWKNGKRDGVFQCRKPDGTIEEQEFNNGNRIR